MKTAIIYSFNTTKSKKAAEKIMDAFGKDKIEALNAEEITAEKFLSYDFLILSLPTWFDGELPNYWDEFVPELEDLDLKEKTFALYGLGNQKEYPENFGDAVGIMADILENAGGKLIGFTSTEGYEFEQSLAVRENQFMGLMLDQDTQPKQSAKRIKDWIAQLNKEF
jgi:flavodoxin I